MNTAGSTMAHEIAQAAVAFERHRSGHAPESVSVVLGEGTLVVALHGALSPAEHALAQTPDGAARVQELQQQLFLTAGDALRENIRRITGVAVREAAAAIKPDNGSVVHAFTTGTLVQVYLLAGAVPVESWSGVDPGSAPSDIQRGMK
jgi:uncharacterized protein YbcI